MPALERLLYASTATGRTDSLLNVATILAESQRNNARDGLTGALAAHEGRFLQVIEGPPAVLDRLLRRLEGDPRHKTIVVIDRVPIAERRFGAWTMANARITPSLTAHLDALITDPSVDPARTVAALLEASREG
ncbi:MAG: BLUF domain-containing protein [Alphaproteobacteria bacterium]|nr:BLUF domain-containing protein [Alphaproteobacteria bacterium]MBU2380788.1 BLUF domain-containing protein [Alphaproteobacteria bacterium]